MDYVSDGTAILPFTLGLQTWRSKTSLSLGRLEDGLVIRPVRGVSATKVGKLSRYVRKVKIIGQVLLTEQQIP